MWMDIEFLVKTNEEIDDASANCHWKIKNNRIVAKSGEQITLLYIVSQK